MRKRHPQRKPVVAEGDPLLTPEQKARNREAAELLREWMQAEHSYDDEVWPLIEEELQDQRLRMVV